MNWQQPQIPRFTHLFLLDQMAENEAKGKKEQAFDTPFRYSAAGSCGRQLAYSMLGYEGEPFDAGGTLVTGLGTYLHEQIQIAILKRYPDAQFEIPTKIGPISGHCDGVVTIDGERILLEFKTVNGTAYKKATGASYKGLVNPSGPRMSAILQSAINAMANDCDTIVIGEVGMEAISKGMAEKIGLPDVMRVISEWVIPKEVWEPLAYRELARLEIIADTVSGGNLPYRIAVGDDGEEMSLTPGGRDWQCQYCPHWERCETDGGGSPEIGE